MIETHSGTPHMSHEQRLYFERKKKEALSGLESFFADKDFWKMPMSSQYRDFHTWRMNDVKSGTMHPVHILKCNYEQFIKYAERVEYESRCKYEAGDISEELYDAISEELEIRRIFFDAEFSTEAKKIITKIYNEEERAEIRSRFSKSLIECAKEQVESRAKVCAECARTTSL